MDKKNSESVCQKIVAIIAEIPGTSPERVQALGWDQEITASGVIDSLAMIQIVHEIEEKFGIEIDFDDLTPENFKTVRTIAQLIEVKAGSTHGETKRSA